MSPDPTCLAGLRCNCVGPRGTEGVPSTVHLGQVRNMIRWEMKAFALDCRNAILALRGEGGNGYPGPDGVTRPDTCCAGWRYIP